MTTLTIRGCDINSLKVEYGSTGALYVSVATRNTRHVLSWQYSEDVVYKTLQILQTAYREQSDEPVTIELP